MQTPLTTMLSASDSALRHRYTEPMFSKFGTDSFPPIAVSQAGVAAHLCHGKEKIEAGV